MPYVGNAQVWQAGTRVRVRRDPVLINNSLVPQPWRELGLCEPVNLGNTPTDIDILDSASGMAKLVGKVRTRQQEIFEISSKNLNMDNLALIYGNALPAAYSQTATPITSEPHVAWPGGVVLLKKTSNGVDTRIYMVASVQSVKKGSTTLVKGTDWDATAEELDEGVIRILPNASGITGGDTITIDFTPRAITGNRLIIPDFSSCGVITCDAELVWSRCDGGEKTIRSIRAALTVTQTNIQLDNPSTISVRLEKITDPSRPFPDGQLIYIKGNL